MIDTDDYEGHTPGPWEWYDDDIIEAHGDRSSIARMEYHYKKKDAILITDAPLLLAEVKRLQSEPTVTVDDYHKKGHLYITVRFPDGDEYVGLVEKWEGEEE